MNRRWLYLAATAADWIVLGFFTVAMSWMAITETGRTASVGLFWFTASLASLLLSPLLGAFLDTRRNQSRRLGAKATAAIGSIFCILAAVLGRFARTPAVSDPSEAAKPFLERLTRGGRLILADRQLLVPACLVVSAFSISQISNALLAPILAHQGRAQPNLA